MNFPLRQFLAIAAATAGCGLQAAITLGAPFGDHAVFQREKPLPVWGRANPGEHVIVRFHDQAVGATAGADGRWIVCLAPLAASADPAELTVTADKETLTIRDIVVGELWLASGQSNMELPVSRLADDEQKIAAAELPLVRELKIERNVAPTPAETGPTAGGFDKLTAGWQAATPDHVGHFSAVAFFFARELQQKLGVPVGIINSTWGGTAIEAWMSDRARASTSLASAIDTRWQHAMSEWPPERIARYPAESAAWQKADEEAHARHTKNLLPWPQPPATPDSPRAPGGLFNGMIAPLQPAAIRGMLWYQGESNAGRPQEYTELLEVMIRSWRETWGRVALPPGADSTLPFYIVQLPNFVNDDAKAPGWALLREAQAKALELPATGLAVAIDGTEPDNLHPTHKMELGRRLALIARAQVYGAQVDFSGPGFAGVTREGLPAGAGAALRVHFTHAGNGLIAYDRPVQSLELAGADRVFHPATAKIAGDTLLVSSPAVKEPVAVRYAFSNAPAANLYNGAGLPAVPFRSDDW